MTVAHLLDGRRALVVGAAGAIGAAVARELHAAGAEVVGLDLPGTAAQLACDVTDESQVTSAFAAAGEVTDVVAAAGVLSVGAVRDLSLSEWRRTLEVNLTGSFIVAREAARCLPEGGTLTLVASQAGRRGGAGWSAYSASKAGVLGLTQCLAQELADDGVRVNAVCPGSVDTPMTRRALAELGRGEGRSAEAVRADYERAIPAGRLASPEEIARVCLFLVSPLSSYVIGASLMVDGGELTT